MRLHFFLERWCAFPETANLLLDSYMASFASLPPELLHRVIALSLEPVSPPETPQRRPSPLLSLSLVALAWVYPCQSLLWRDMHLTKSSAAQQWLQVAPGARFLTRSMRIDGESLWDEGIRSDEMREVLKASKGLRKLTICGVRPLDPAAFSLANLEGTSWWRSRSRFNADPASVLSPDLATLIFENLHKVFLHPVAPSFHLTTLCLQSASLPSSLFDSLLVASGTTLVNLSLSYPLVMDPASQTLPLIAPQLRHLHLGNSCDSFLPLVPHCTSLYRLSLGDQESVVLPSLPLSLHILALDMKDLSLLKALLGVSEQLARERKEMQLRTLELREDMRHSLTEGSWETFRDAYGIELVFGPQE